MGKKIKIGVFGISGRMGRLIATLLLDGKGNLELAAAFDSPGAPLIGHDIGEMLGRGKTGITVTDDILIESKKLDVIIDFSTPDASLELAGRVREHKTPMVVGTTGFSNNQLEDIKIAAKSIPLLIAPNMSLGINLLARLVEEAAKALPQEFQIEIVETHHQYKQDAPSGTALFLGAAAAKGRGLDFDKAKVLSREGMIGDRSENQIGIQTIRGGDVVGDHTVFYLGTGERLELTHRATSRDTFAAGSIRAASWLVDKKPGLYDMLDVLGLK